METYFTQISWLLLLLSQVRVCLSIEKKRVVVITTAKRSFFRWKLHIISLFSIEEENPTLFSLSYLVSFNVDPKLIFFYSIHWWTVNLEFPLFPLPDQTSYSPPCSWLVIDRTVALHPKAAVPLKIRLFSLCIQLFLDRFSAGIVYRKGWLESSFGRKILMAF